MSFLKIQKTKKIPVAVKNPKWFGCESPAVKVPYPRKIIRNI